MPAGRRGALAEAGGGFAIGMGRRGVRDRGGQEGGAGQGWERTGCGIGVGTRGARDRGGSEWLPYLMSGAPQTLRDGHRIMEMAARYPRFQALLDGGSEASEELPGAALYLPGSAKGGLLAYERQNGALKGECVTPNYANSTESSVSIFVLFGFARGMAC